MKKGIKPLAIFLLILVIIGAFVVGGVVKHFLPDAVEQFKNLISWGVIIGVGGLGAVIVGRVFGKR